MKYVSKTVMGSAASSVHALEHADGGLAHFGGAIIQRLDDDQRQECVDCHHAARAECGQSARVEMQNELACPRARVFGGGDDVRKDL